MLPSLPSRAPFATTPHSALCAHCSPPPLPCFQAPDSSLNAAEPPSAGLGSLLSFPGLSEASQGFPVRRRPPRRGRTRGRLPGEAWEHSAGRHVRKEPKPARDRVLLPPQPVGLFRLNPLPGSGLSPQWLLPQLPRTHPELRVAHPQPLPSRTRWLRSLDPCAEHRSRGRENREAGSGKSGEEVQERRRQERGSRAVSIYPFAAPGSRCPILETLSSYKEAFPCPGHSPSQAKNWLHRQRCEGRGLRPGPPKRKHTHSR